MHSSYKRIQIPESFIIVSMFLYRWVHPEFEDEENISREVETGTGPEQEVVVEVEHKREMVNNCINSREEEKIVVDMEIESSRL